MPYHRIHWRDRRRSPGRTTTRRVWSRAAILLAAALLSLAAFTNGVLAKSSILQPAGPVADRIRLLTWVIFIIAAVVFVVVVAFLLVGVFRSPREFTDPTVSETPAWHERVGLRTIIIGGIVLPFIILAGVFAFTLNDMVTLGKSDPPGDLTIDVTGHQWWWQVNYPDQQITTANEIHIPVGRRVTIRLHAADVIHSFWVPQLAQKTDLIPGKTNEMWLQADKPGTYRGQCAEFCGVQHANMAFYVIADRPADFTAWVKDQQQPAANPSADLVRGQQVFMSSACMYCHTISGSDASGKVGPDLTHLASRQTLAAGMLTNNRGNLAGWILNPQGIKPNNEMPATKLTPDELHALLDYLQSLK